MEPATAGAKWSQGCRPHGVQSQACIWAWDHSRRHARDTAQSKPWCAEIEQPRPGPSSAPATSWNEAELRCWTSWERRFEHLCTGRNSRSRLVTERACLTDKQSPASSVSGCSVLGARNCRPEAEWWATSTHAHARHGEFLCLSPSVLGPWQLHRCFLAGGESLLAAWSVSIVVANQGMLPLCSVFCCLVLMFSVVVGARLH